MFKKAKIQSYNWNISATPHIYFIHGDGIMTKRGEGGGGVSWIALVWPSSGRGKGQDARLPGSGGALASHPRAKRHPTRNQGLYNATTQRITQGGWGRDPEARRDPQQENPPGSERDLVQDEGDKWGSSASR